MHFAFLVNNMAENLSLFLRGLLIGISIAAPVGPIGILCIRRTLAEGKLIGFLSGMGAASADMVYGAIAAFGLTVVTDLLVDNAFWLRLIGGCFLLYLGVKTFLEKPANHAAQASQSGYFGAYISTFFLTITNPMTILSFAAIFAGTMFLGNTSSPIVLVAGVFARVSSLVAGTQLRGRVDARPTKSKPHDMDQSNFRFDHYHIWNYRARFLKRQADDQIVDIRSARACSN